jgi:hypothetical protein
MGNVKKSLIVLLVLAVVILGTVATGLGSDNIISSIEKAPVAPDGNVAGAVTDLVINLDSPLDPAVQGRSLQAGHSIKVTLPDQFVNMGSPPLQDVFSSPACVPGNLQCSTAVLLQGWPQHPILPRVPPVPPGTGVPHYTLSLEGTNTLVFTANVDLIPGVALPGPGIKQIHLILNGFRNPQTPGFYKITVEAETGPNGAVETGSGMVHILPQNRPSIHITSAFNAGSPNTIYQQTGTGQLTPLPYDFLLWERDGSPFEGVTVEMVSANHALLRQGERVFGQVEISAPPGATGQELFTQAPSAAINAPITGLPAARLTVFFRLGSLAGDYRLTFSLEGGNAVQMFVTAE